MSTTPLVTLDEYLNSSYEPDVEFLDGVLWRRNVGTQLHGFLQIIVGAYFLRYRKSHQIRAFTETRLLVGSGRYRVPDVMAVKLPYQKGKVVVDVPLIVVEIKSPEDTFDDILDRCFDYEKLGVRNNLVMDPDNKRVWTFEHGDLRLRTEPSLSLSLSEETAIDLPSMDLFAELDED